MKINHKITSIVLTLGLISSSIYTINVNAETLNSKIQVSNLNLSNSYNIKNENLIKSSKEGWINTNGIWYFYKNGIMQTGWLNDNGIWYYLNENGSMATGWYKVDSNWYYSNSNGVMQTGWLNDNGNWYYLNDNGSMATGWYKVDSNWYYSNSNGVMQTGWLNDNGTWYYLNDNGSMATGWYKVYSKWYYSNSNGVMQTGWLNDNGTWYYLNSSGEMVTNTIIDGWKIDSNGIATPLKDENHSIVYVTPNGKSYHYSKDCTALKRSSSILGMSLNEAINKGKSDPCNLCVK
ncbi:cell wall-binding protein [Clostridium perfringens]|uniref:cell wall-binding protein n=1 Tax=Clostridium perfringens TaxID=1502 RepID=UPI003D2A7D33